MERTGSSAAAVVQKVVPAGTYLISFTGTIHNSDSTMANTDCELVSPLSHAARVSVPVNGFGSISLLDAATFSASTTIEVDCGTSVGEVFTASLTALQVGSLS